MKLNDVNKQFFELNLALGNEYQIEIIGITRKLSKERRKIKVNEIRNQGTDRTDRHRIQTRNVCLPMFMNRAQTELTCLLLIDNQFFFVVFVSFVCLLIRTNERRNEYTLFGSLEMLEIIVDQLRSVRLVRSVYLHYRTRITCIS